jgi:hypothetical protein
MSFLKLFPDADADFPDESTDEQVGAWLSELDPGRESATYWMRFHRDTVNAASFELARRRREAQRTVTDVVSSWSRVVVSAAVVAAAAAGVFLAQSSADVTEGPLGVEEVLLFGLAEPASVEIEAPGDRLESAVRFTAEAPW